MPVSLSTYNNNDCYCPECPTYPGGEGVLYCSRGESAQALKPLSCLCPECPVFIRNGLHAVYYCLLGKHEIPQSP